MRPIAGAAAGIAAALVASGAAAEDLRYLSFRALCADHAGEPTATKAAAEADGWHDVTAADSAELAGLLDMIVDDDTGEEAVAYRMTPDGAVFLVLTVSDDGAGTFFQTCGLYDFAARAPFGREALLAWRGTPEAKSSESQWGSLLYWKGPPLADADWEISLVYNPPGGLMNSIDGFTGAALVSNVSPPGFHAASESQQ